MYTTKGTRTRRGIATRDSATRISSGSGYAAATKSRSSKPERNKRNQYSRDNYNTSWEYGYKTSGSGVTNRAPDPSMCVNHTMEFVDLDNYIANLFR